MKIDLLSGAASLRLIVFSVAMGLGNWVLAFDASLGCKKISFEGEALVNSVDHPLARKLHLIYIANESKASHAYCLSNAKMDNGLNGLSFGIKQWDVATCANCWDNLLAVLAAGDKDSAKPVKQVVAAGKSLLSRCMGPETKFISGGNCFGRPAMDFNDPVTQDLIDKASAGIQTPSARKAMDALYSVELKEQLAALEKHVSEFSPQMGAKPITSESDAAKLLILDYENFFGAACFFAAMKSKAGSKGCSKINRLAPGESAVTEADIIKYVLGTRQGRSELPTGEREAFRRINNVLRIAGWTPNFNDTTSARDRDYFRGELKSRLVAMKLRTKVQKESPVETETFEKLIAMAESS